MLLSLERGRQPSLGPVSDFDHHANGMLTEVNIHNGLPVLLLNLVISISEALSGHLARTHPHCHLQSQSHTHTLICPVLTMPRLLYSNACHILLDHDPSVLMKSMTSDSWPHSGGFRDPCFLNYTSQGSIRILQITVIDVTTVFFCRIARRNDETEL